MKVFGSTTFLFILTCAATEASNEGGNTSSGSVTFADENVSIKACPCLLDNTCTSLDESEDAVQRLCIWSNAGSSDLISISSLTLVHTSVDDNSKAEFIPLVPSPDIPVACAPQDDANLCTVSNIPLGDEFFLDAEDTTVALIGSGSTRTFHSSNVRGSNVTNYMETEDIAFQLRRSSVQENGIPVTAVAVVSGMAVLFQTTYFLIRYSYSRSKADLPA